MAYLFHTQEELADEKSCEDKCLKLINYLANPPAECIISSLERTLTPSELYMLKGLTGAKAWTILQQKGEGKFSKTGTLPTIDSSANLKKFIETEFLTRMKEGDPVINQFDYRLVSRGVHYYECFELQKNGFHWFERSVYESVIDATVHITNGKQSSSGLGWHS